MRGMTKLSQIGRRSRRDNGLARNGAPRGGESLGDPGEGVISRMFPDRRLKKESDTIGMESGTFFVAPLVLLNPKRSQTP